MSRIPSLGPRGEGWVAVQLVLLVAIMGACWWPGGRLNWPGMPIVAVVGVLVLVAGLALVLVGALGLSSSLTVMPRPKEDGLLVTTGLYRSVRHPIYAGVMAAMLGASLAARSWVALLLTAALVVVLDLKTRREEVFLRERFSDYAAYAARTKRFIPGIY